MIRRSLREECGYSLVEVMASIIILTIAILPMVVMFDMGLNMATRGSNYDKARALANLKMEGAKSLPFATAKDSFPVTGSTPNTSTGYYDSGFIDEEGPASADFENFQYRVEKKYMKPPTTISPQNFLPCSDVPNTCSTDQKLIRVTVTVGWGSFSSGTYSNTYTTFGLVTG